MIHVSQGIDWIYLDNLEVADFDTTGPRRKILMTWFLAVPWVDLKLYDR